MFYTVTSPVWKMGNLYASHPVLYAWVASQITLFVVQPCSLMFNWNLNDPMTYVCLFFWTLLSSRWIRLCSLDFVKSVVLLTTHVWWQMLDLRVRFSKLVTCLAADALASVNYHFRSSLGICLSILVLLTTLGFCLPSFFNITITVVSSDVRLVKYLYITFSAEGCFVAPHLVRKPAAFAL